MKQFWNNLSPIWKTVLACLAMETGLFLLLLIFSRSLIISLMVQIVLFGPPTLFFAPFLYKKYKKLAEKKKGLLSE
ncbi:hypothetical protein DFR42_102133 [Undibacterium pigrum]|uniref:Uncharacterized protein n=1 Tax=Undibacterium pigrum TaxID=401470 RepID=A0A318JLW8_9BURK|nr:hypothetical protein DFR42_102133 [Undibacterium pigrum]